MTPNLANWHFILILAGKPVASGMTYGDMRNLIMDLPRDDIESMSVWQVRDWETLQPTEDVTIPFAVDWASRDHAERADHHPFVLHHVGLALGAGRIVSSVEIEIGGTIYPVSEDTAERIKELARTAA